MRGGVYRIGDMLDFNSVKGGYRYVRKNTTGNSARQVGAGNR